MKNPAPPQPNEPAICPALDPCVTFSDRTYGGVNSYVVHHPVRSKYFRLGAEEYFIVRLLDGKRSVGEIGDQARAAGVQWSDEKIASLVAQLTQNGLLSVATPQQPEAEAKSLPLMHRILKLLSFTVSQRLPLTNGDRIASRLVGTLGHAFSFPAMIVWALLVGSGLLVVFNSGKEFSDELIRIFDPGIWPLLILLWCVAKIIHELGHAVCAKYHGVKVGKAGVMFFLLAPLAYVDVTDAWKLRRRSQRVQIALAGVYLELGIAAIAAWAWWYLPAGMCKHIAAQIFVVAGPATLLVNANPLLRLDGYYLLSDLLEIPNLRMHGRRQLGGQLSSWLVSIPAKPPLLQGWRRHFATAHAFCSVIFQFFWMGGLVFAVATWARGLGIVLACCAGLLWGVIPLVRWGMSVWNHEPGGSWKLSKPRRRLIGLALTSILVAQYFALQASPFARRVPVIVQHKDEQIARARVAGFVDEVFVTSGQKVSKGMLLLKLRQPQLVVQQEQHKDDLEMAQRRAIQFRGQGDIAGSLAETAKANSLRRQLQEMDEQVAHLMVVAERDGIVTSPYTKKLVGSYVSKGDELVRIADPTDKELLISVGENDVEAYEQSIGKLARVRIRGGTELKATPAELRPRARQILNHQALAASAGGPIAVEPSESADKLRYVTPQFHGVIDLDSRIGRRLRAGQIGMMTIADNRSLFKRIYDAASSVQQ